MLTIYPEWDLDIDDTDYLRDTHDILDTHDTDDRYRMSEIKKFLELILFS